jgi:Tfp pilus assembly protein PilX
MRKSGSERNCEMGSVLVISMLVLVLLTLIGIAAVTTSTIETDIAGNQRFQATAFFEADAGLETAQELLEQNIACPEGFTATDTAGAKVPDAAKGPIMVERDSLAFYQNLLNPNVKDTGPSDAERDAYLPADYAGRPHTNLTFKGRTVYSKGSSLQMAAGYEGIGKGAAGGGAYIQYNITAQHLGVARSESVFRGQWRHIIILSREGECKY